MDWAHGPKSEGVDGAGGRFMRVGVVMIEKYRVEGSMFAGRV